MSRKIAILMVLVMAGGLLAQAGTTPSGDQAKLVKLTVTAQPQTEPALKYLLMPAFWEKKTGNAALLYYQAIDMAGMDDQKKKEEQVDKFRGKAPGELNVAEAAEAVKPYRNALNMIRDGALARECDWGYQYEKGIEMLLPGMREIRQIGYALQLDNRVHLARHEVEPVLANLKTGFGMARDIGKGPILIAALVDTAIAAMMVSDMQYLIQEPDAPNLYWALTGLPRPFAVNTTEIMQSEKSMIYFTFPRLADIEKRIMPAEEAQREYERIIDIMAMTKPELKEILMKNAQAAVPQARETLIQSGMDKAKVEAMPPLQAVLIVQLRELDIAYDDFMKWFMIDYATAKAPMDAAIKKAESNKMAQNMKGPESNPLLGMLPALDRAYFVLARLDRQIAVLRVVEALRSYAAAHEGKLPGSLAEVTEVPLPLDPLTGKAFTYKLDGDTAVIDWPAGFAPKDGERYEITIRK